MNNKIIRSQKGLTLLEILIVIGIMGAVLAVSSSFFSGGINSAMREQAHKLIRFSRYSFDQSLSTGLYYRLQIDLEEQKYVIQSSEEPVLLVRPDDELEKIRRLNLENDPDNEEEFDVESYYEEELNQKFSEEASDIVDQVTLEGDVRISDVFVQNQPEVVTQGQVSIYFFPRGQCEFAVIHLENPESPEDVMTLILNPMSGEMTIQSEYVDHEEILAEKESYF
jgi:prepilin-type N-terminal cleavage/methylation domain-containing protein